MNINTIYNEDCLETLTRIKEEVIDLVITSPPYDNLRKYNGYLFNFEQVAQELLRVLSPGGVVIWVVGDSTVGGSETGSSFKQALYFKEIGFNLHDTMIYRKKNFTPLTHNRYEQEWEYIFCLSKGKPKTFNPIKVPCLYAGHTTWGNPALYKTNDGSLTIVDKIIVKETKIKGNIFEYQTGSTKTGKIKHPAMFPEQLVYDQMISWSNPGDLVYDPFMGSGTTAKVARQLNRAYIGSEISKEYCEIAEKRINEPR